VDVAIDYLEVWQSPVVEQLRPSFIAMVAPDLKQGDAMIYLGVPPKPSACLENQLVTEKEVLGFKPTTRLEQVDEHSKCINNRKHRP
jgi:hypothetical protein